MTGLSISRVWEETRSFAGRNAGALFTIAFAMIALPSIIMQALVPTPGEAPAAVFAILLFPVVLVLSVAGSLAVTALALGREEVVGSAIRHGFRRVLPMLGASILLGLAGIILTLPIFLLLGIELDPAARASTADAGRLALFILIALPLLLLVWVRLLLLTPVAAAEDVGPIAIIRRSWQLTRGHTLRLFGFVLLLVVSALIVMMMVTFLIGIPVALIAGPPEPGSLAALLMLLVAGLINTAFVVIFTTMAARVYVQLVEPSISGS